MKNRDTEQQVHAVTRTFQVCKYDPSTPLPMQLQAPTNEDRVRRFRASDDTIDRYNDVILAEGWDLTNYAKNSVVMQFHDYHSWPIGKAIAAGVIDEALFIDSEFDPADIDEGADMVLKKIDHGTIKTGSVGFIPREWVIPNENKDLVINGRSVTVDELFEKYPNAERIFTKQELLEWTICPIPANPNALVSSLRRNYSARYKLDEFPTDEPEDELAIPKAAFDRVESMNKILAGD